MRDSLKRSIYLLTVWQERTASPGKLAVWRISLEDARTGQKRAFANLEELLIFFQQRMANEDQLNRRCVE